MKLRPKITLIDHFSNLSDPRIDRTKEHKLIDIVVIAICAVNCGADGWVGMETDGKAKYKWLKQFLELPNGIPSDDTFSRVFARLAPEEFQVSFLNWVKSISKLIAGEIVSIDGKTLRGAYDKGHGRIEIRRYWTMGNVEFLLDSEKWLGLKSIGMVESRRTINGETTRETRYYLNSFSSNAEIFAQAVRGHWGIENCLHWVLDVSFREDDCRIRQDNSPENLSVLRHLALNLLSQEKTAKIGVKNKRLKAAWDDQYLAQVLGI